MRLPRPPLAVLAAASAAAVVFVHTGPSPSDDGARAAALGQTSPGAAATVLEALRSWDVGRARAWASGDVSALRSLYTPGSAAGERDVAMLRRWSERGLRVEGMETQVLAARVVAQSSDRAVVVVTDRLAHAVATGGEHRWTLPRDRPSTREVSLRRRHGSWRVAAVLPVLPVPAGSAER